MNNNEGSDIRDTDDSAIAVHQDEQPRKNWLVDTFPIVKPIITRLLFLLLILMTATGNTDRIGRAIMSPVIDYDIDFLEDSMVKVAGYSFLFFGLKVVLDPLDSIVLEPQGLASKLGSIKVGEALEPFTELAEDGFDFMKFSAVIIAIQIAVLKLIKFLSLKLFIGAGSILCFFQYRKDSFFGRMGWILIFIGLMVFIIYPVILQVSAQSYNSFQSDRAVSFAENTGVIIEQLKDIDLTELSKAKENIAHLSDVLKGGLNIIWTGLWNIIVGFILIFIITPLFSLGGMYFLTNQFLQYMDMASAQAGLDGIASKTVNSLGKRSRKRFLNKGVKK